MSLYSQAMDILERTSRTFYIPISRLPPQLLEAVASAYLCMRAIDEVEDHPDLHLSVKSRVLRQISLALQTIQADGSLKEFPQDFRTYGDRLPEVTLRIDEWLRLAPNGIVPRICDATAAMADRMAHWTETGWQIHSEADLDSYTFSVAGAVGLLLSDLWIWYNGTQTDRGHAVGFGRGLQAVNILRNRQDDLIRDVNFFPNGWDDNQMHAYASRNLALADAYTAALAPGPVLDFCSIPLALAHATLDVLVQGREKLSRKDVMRITAQLGGA